MNYDEAIEIAPGIYWIGFYDKTANFHCNPYLIVDNDEAIIIDPGSEPHFPIVARKVVSVIDPKKISYVILSHQDPDLAGSMTVFEDLISNPELKVVANERVSFLLAHYGFKSPFYFIEKNGMQLRLKSGRELQFLFTPYVHSPNAYVTYDVKSKILFSSDLFGAFSEHWDLYADEDYNEHMRTFHAPYMSSHEAMLSAMNKIEKLDLEMIASQHGMIIKKDKIQRSIDFLKNLEVGQYLKEHG